MIRVARRSAAMACLVLLASLSALPAAQAAPHWKIKPCRAGLQAYWLPKQVVPDIFIACTTSADRNQQINDALESNDPTRIDNALDAILQQNADSFLTRKSPCTPGQEAAIDDAYAKCVG
jgi:hypothetical protein